MAEAPQEDAGFDPSIIFTGIGKFVRRVYAIVEAFVDTPGRPGVLSFGLQFTPYYVGGVFFAFFFFWTPLHPHATAVWFQIFAVLIPFVLPALLYTLADESYFSFMTLRNYYSHEYCVLEIRLPEDITQTPYSMEQVLRGIYQTGEVDTEVQRILGATKPWFSLEIVSTEGRVRFFMWGRRRYKELMENQVYAHYPTVQVVEVEDYTLQVPFDPALMTVWGVEQRLQKADPFPIVTYKEIETLGSSSPLAEAEAKKVDPLAAVIEFMGAIGEGEHLWTQFIIRAHEARGRCPWAVGTDRDTKGMHKINEPISLAEWARIEIDKILEKVKGRGDTYNFAGLTKGDRDQIESIQAKLNKQPFDTGIRSVYVARHDRARGAPRTGIPSAFRSFEHGSEGRGLNGLRPEFWVGPFNFPWQDFRGIRRVMLQRRFYNAYAMRQFFWNPHRHRWIVLNTEELATLYHFPGRVVATPNLERMPSRRGEAPANLPV